MKTSILIIVLTALSYIGMLAQPQTTTLTATKVVEYESSEWTANTESGCVLQGTLLNAGKDTPVVLIIAGSGPTDREGNQAASGLRTDAYKMLAIELAKRGISSLRYDKRSTYLGKTECIEREEDMSIDLFAEDAVIMIEGLRSSDNFSDIFVLGHSQGSLLGMLAAQMTQFDGFISLAGPGLPAHEVMAEQLAKQLPPAMMAEVREDLDSLAMGEIVKDYNRSLEQLFHSSLQPFLMSWFKYDPAELASTMDMPVMVISGGVDIQVSEKEGEILSEAFGTKPVVFPEMSHTLKEIKGGDMGLNQKSYQDPSVPLQPGLADTIVSFIKGNTE